MPPPRSWQAAPRTLSVVGPFDGSEFDATALVTRLIRAGGDGPRPGRSRRHTAGRPPPPWLGWPPCESGWWVPGDAWAGRCAAPCCRRPGLELVAAVDPVHAGTRVEELIGPVAGPGPTRSRPSRGIAVAASTGALVDAGVDVAVDFTRLEASRSTIAFCAGAGIHTVVGTTGFTDADLAELGRMFDPAVGSGRGPTASIAANFAIGAVLMMRFASLAAPWFDGAEIIELHHEGKRDAPSGTSLRTAERMAAARAAASRASSRPTPPASWSSRAPEAGPGPVACASTPSGCPDWWPTRRSCSARGPGTHHPARLLRPGLVHGRCRAGRGVGGVAPGPDRRHRVAARDLRRTGNGRHPPADRRGDLHVCGPAGVAKTTVEDVAREAGVSRATVYRAFPGGRDEMVNATVAWATLEFFAGCTSRSRAPAAWRR